MRSPRLLRGAVLSALLMFGLASCGGDDSDPTPPQADPPDAPGNVQVESVGEGSVTLSWNSVSGADSYTVYYAAQSGVTKDNYASLPEGGRVQDVTSPFEITGLTEPGTYFFVITASNSDGESDESLQVSATPETALNPAGDMQLAGGDYSFTSVDIPSGTTITVTGPVTIEVEDDALIEGTIAGDCQAIELRVGGDFTLDGLLTNVCGTLEEEDGPGIKIVADGDVVVGSAPSAENAIVTDGLLRITDSATEDEDFEIVTDVDEGAAFSGGAPQAPARQAGEQPVREFNDPLEADEHRLSFDGDIEVNAELTARPGKAAPAQMGSPVCDSRGATAEPGGDIYLFARGGTLTVAANAKAGNGGTGADCTATGEGAEAFSGPGARGGGVYLGGQELVFQAGAMVTRGDGGAGGRARAEGDHGDEDCEDGFPATALGGQGGQAGGAGYISEAEPVIQGNPMEAGGNGGTGGEGSARGGDGAACVCDLNEGKGGDGGVANATGGQGGDGARGSLFPVVAGTHEKGEGGVAEAFGGFGGAGADCCEEGAVGPGGAGGDGGDAVATGGQQGERGINEGKMGRATTFGGEGGEGGDGNGPGTGGAGGDATSVGDPVDQNPGSPGLDGEPCPVEETAIGISLEVDSDPSNHDAVLMMSSMVDELTVQVASGAVTITGNGNFIPVIGDIDQDGNFIATGSGSVGGYNNVSVTLTGTIGFDGSGNPQTISGTYTVGGNGAFPGGQPVTYSVGPQ